MEGAWLHSGVPSSQHPTPPEPRDETLHDNRAVHLSLAHPRCRSAVSICQTQVAPLNNPDVGRIQFCCHNSRYSAQMQLSVVVPVRNEEHRIGAQLDALLDQEVDGDWEIIVVDNGSTDGTVALIESYTERSDRVRLVKANERADQSYAANAGVAASSASAVVFCDGDDIVAKGWLAAMAHGLQSHDVVTGCSELDLLNPAWLADCRGRSAEGPVVGSFAGIFPVVQGNSYGVRFPVWEKIGPLNDGFFPVADVEFSFRCWINGIEIVSLPEAVVHYRYRQSARDLWRQGWKYGSHRPMIARLLRDAGRQTPARFAGWKSWVLLLITVPTIVTRHGRVRWLWVAANRLGQIAGSVRHRIIML